MLLHRLAQGSFGFRLFLACRSRRFLRIGYVFCSQANPALDRFQLGGQIRNFRRICFMHRLELTLQFRHTRVHYLVRRPIGIGLIAQPHRESNYPCPYDFECAHFPVPPVTVLMHTGFHRKKSPLTPIFSIT
jgi:hypothetical protein